MVGGNQGHCPDLNSGHPANRQLLYIATYAIKLHTSYTVK